MAEADVESTHDWPTCGSEDCIGIRLPAQERCLVHVAPAVLERFLDGLQPGDDVDLRGTLINVDLLERLLAALTAPGKDGPELGKADFQQARFSGSASFLGARFTGEASFAEAEFTGDVSFKLASFGGNASFTAARFGGGASFMAAEFVGTAWFEAAQFGGDAGFQSASFLKESWLARTQFSGAARFHNANFRDRTFFGGVRFSGDVRFEEVHFTLAGFDRAQFLQARQIGPLQAEIEFSLQEASFSAPVRIEIATPGLALLGVTFQEAAHIRLRFADMVLDGSLFAKPVTISYVSAGFQTMAGLPMEEMGILARGSGRAQPRLLSLRMVDASNLVLENLDLTAAKFQGVHNLEKLRIEGPLRFRGTPSAWRLRIGHWELPVLRRWTRRQAIAEEHSWRWSERIFGDKHGWRVWARLAGPYSLGPIWRPDWSASLVGPVWLPREIAEQWQETATPESLAALYRALRKGLEDQRNAPGAADFYYGEMEMRRRSPTSQRSDRFLLWVYWLFSGYGLRASRALLAFAILVPVFAIGFWLWGLNPPPKGLPPIGYQTALLRSFESATSLLRAPPAGLNEFGQWLDAFLRLIGATLLGLALFSLRGRIKR